MVATSSLKQKPAKPKRSKRDMLVSAQLRGTAWRRRILSFLEAQHDPLTPLQLHKAMLASGDMLFPPTVYRVLRDLESGGLVVSEPYGAQRAYRLAP